MALDNSLFEYRRAGEARLEGVRAEDFIKSERVNEGVRLYRGSLEGKGAEVSLLRMVDRRKARFAYVNLMKLYKHQRDWAAALEVANGLLEFQTQEGAGLKHIMMTQKRIGRLVNAVRRQKGL